MDRAASLIDVPDRDIGDAAAVTPEPGDLFAGVARLDDGLLLIHDLEAFRTEAEALELDTAVAAAVGTGGEPPEPEVP